MATPEQIRANQSNAQLSTGPTSEEGKQASSQNRTTHGLTKTDNKSFYLMLTESPEKLSELRAQLREEHQPQTETEHILVRRLGDHEWLRARALRFQQECLAGPVFDTAQFALFMRYQTNQERAFYKALNELQKLRAERTKQEIGFESQKRLEAAEQRAAEAHEMKKQEFELKKERAARPRHPEKTQNQPAAPVTLQIGTAPLPETSPGELKTAA
jgi:hypothetical protein